MTKHPSSVPDQASRSRKYAFVKLISNHIFGKGIPAVFALVMRNRYFVWFKWFLVCMNSMSLSFATNGRHTAFIISKPLINLGKFDIHKV